MIQSAVQPKEIVSRYVPLLRALAEQISRETAQRRHD
jgi:hypothetical protein